METIKQRELQQERDAILAKNDELRTELQAIIKKSEERNAPFTPEEDARSRFISGYMHANRQAIQDIDRKLEIYEIIGDCFDAFYKQLEVECEIKPKKVIIRGADLLDEFRRAEEAKKHEVKRKKQ